LAQQQLTADGNHHANRYRKNGDPLNRSLFCGRAYFPLDDILMQYLRPFSGTSAEVSLVRIDVGNDLIAICSIENDV
jgi:hypothetical protein